MQTQIYEILDLDYMVELQTRYFAECTPERSAAYMIKNSEPMRIFEIAADGVAVGFIGIRNAARDWYLGPRLNGSEGWINTSNILVA